MAITFDLDAVERSERQDTLGHLMSLLPVPIDVTTPTLDALSVRTTSDWFGNIFLMSCHGRGAVVGRNGRRVAQDHPRTLFLSVLAAGRSLLEQRDVASMLTIGDIVVYSSTSRYRATFDRVAKHTFMIAYEALALPDRLVESQLARRIGVANPLGHVVTTYLSRLATDAVHLPAPDRAALERPTIDLLRALLTSVAGDDFRSREPLHDSLGLRIMEHLRSNVADPELSVARIAHHHHISERYAYLILSRFGITFSDWVREQRLIGAATDLSSPAFGAERISAVSRRWGFSDHANFTRAFRRHFGASPSEYRRRALGPTPTD